MWRDARITSAVSRDGLGRARVWTPRPTSARATWRSEASEDAPPRVTCEARRPLSPPNDACTRTPRWSALGGLADACTNVPSAGRHQARQENPIPGDKCSGWKMNRIQTAFPTLLSGQSATSSLANRCDPKAGRTQPPPPGPWAGGVGGVRITGAEARPFSRSDPRGPPIQKKPFLGVSEDRVKMLK